MEGFEGLSSAFDVEDLEQAEQEMAVIENKTQVIETQLKQPVVLQDQNFIRNELKNLILSTMAIKTKVEKDIKIGAEPRKIEVYAKLVESINKTINSLTEMNKVAFEAALSINQIGIGDIGSNKISMTSDQLSDMLERARDNSQMKNIDATFEIKNDKENDK